MRTLACKHCTEARRPTRPITVSYMPLRSGDRRSFFACWWCDSTDMWPNYTRTSPPIPQD